MVTDNHSDDKDSLRSPTLAERLKSSTILGILHQLPKLPENVVDFMRRWSLGSDLDQDNDPKDPNNDHKWAFNRLKRLWDTPDRPQGGDISAVSKFNTARKLCTSYWTGEKSKQAWMQTGVAVGLSAFIAQDTVWAIQASAELVGHLAQFKPDVPESLTSIYNSLAKIGGFGALMVGLNDQLNKARFAMRRDMTNWMTGEFMSALYDKNDGIKNFTHNRQPTDSSGSKDVDAMPENPHQALSENVGRMNQMITWFSTETMSMVLTTGFIIKALYDKSVPLDFLNKFSTHLEQTLPNGLTDFQLGDKGSFALAMACGAGFLGLALPKAKKICKDLEDNYTKVMKQNGHLTSFLVNSFDKGESIAATKSHKPWHQTYEEIYNGLQDGIKADDRNFRRYRRYEDVLSLVGSKFLPLAPGFTAFTAGKLTLQSFTEMQGLITGSIWAINSYIMNTLPAVSRIKTYANGLSEIAEMVDKIKDKKAFYKLSGIHEFEQQTTDNSHVALAMTGVELMHRGFDAKAFITVSSLQLAKGDWALVDGVSGSGKSCLFKSIADLWPYGRGTVQTPKGSKIFYAQQEPDISTHYSLAEQIIYGMEGMPTSLKDYVNRRFSQDETVRQRIEWALNTAGLDEFTERMHEKNHNGRAWSNMLSGGQKQRLVLARILFQQPDILLLDEATSALNPAAKDFFFNTIKEHCPDATVIAIIHDEKMPRNHEGRLLFDKKLKIDNGVVTLENLATPTYAAHVETGISAALHPSSPSLH